MLFLLATTVGLAFGGGGCKREKTNEPNENPSTNTMPGGMNENTGRTSDTTGGGSYGGGPAGTMNTGPTGTGGMDQTGGTMGTGGGAYGGGTMGTAGGTVDTTAGVMGADGGASDAATDGGAKDAGKKLGTGGGPPSGVDTSSNPYGTGGTTGGSNMGGTGSPYGTEGSGGGAP
jgi:hypothetical protein